MRQTVTGCSTETARKCSYIKSEVQGWQIQGLIQNARWETQSKVQPNSKPHDKEQAKKQEGKNTRKNGGMTQQALGKGALSQEGLLI